MLTEKCKTIQLLDRSITYYNQNSAEWSHPYDGNGKNTPMRVRGCGIFSLCHCAQWLTGQVPSPEHWADFAVSIGAVDEWGTIRPVLLQGLMESGEAVKLGFCYKNEGSLEDPDLLASFLLAENGVAIGSIRSGHIVAMVAAREKDGNKQILVIDSAAESCEVFVRQKITEVISEAQVRAVIRNQRGVMLGEMTGYGAYWVDAATVRSFNLMYKTDQE